MNIEKEDHEINELVNRCSEVEESGESIAPGMSYEEGIKAGISWILGWTRDHPLDP